MFDRFSDDDRPLVLSAEDVAFLRANVAPQPVTAEADLTFEICPTCASPIWKGTCPEGSGTTEATLGDCCDRCKGFGHRHPEVFAFVQVHAQARQFIQLRLPPKEAEP